MSFKQAIVATMMMMLAAAARVDKVVAVSAVTTTTTVRRRVKAGKNGPPPPPQGQYYNFKKNPKSSKKNSPTPSPVTSPTPATVLPPLSYRPTDVPTTTAPEPKSTPDPSASPTVVPVVAMTTDEPTDNIDSGFCFADSCPDGNFCDFYLGDRGECVECPTETNCAYLIGEGLPGLAVNDCVNNCSFDKGPVDPDQGPTDCSINQSCPDEYFCNFDIGDAFCEECPTETDCADFAGDGLPEVAVEDCEKKCSVDDLTPVDPNPGPTDCSYTQFCPYKNFCNFEDGTSGRCEECPLEYSDCADLAGDGVENCEKNYLAVEDCEKKCSVDDLTPIDHNLGPTDCSINQSCPNKNFCNFEDGASGRCEECPSEYSDCADLADDERPELAVEDCNYYCDFDYEDENTFGCSLVDSCPNKNFCNFDAGTRGGCEECPSEYDECARSGLSSNDGVEDCEKNCSFDDQSSEESSEESSSGSSSSSSSEESSEEILGPTDCSQSCPDEYFCNFDIGDAFCEECPTETDCADLIGDGLPSNGVEDCEKNCSPTESRSSF